LREREQIFLLTITAVITTAAFNMVNILQFCLHINAEKKCKKNTFKNILIHSRLVASFPGQPGKPYWKGIIILDLTEARDDGVAVASAEPYAKHLHLTPDR